MSLPLLAAVLLPVPALPRTGQLLIVSQGDHSVHFVDPQTLQPAAVYDEKSITGHEVAVTPDGRKAFIPIYGDSGVGKPGTDGQTVQVVDVRTRQLLHTIDFGHGVRPHAAVFDRTRNLVYVTAELDQAIAVIDPATDTVVGSIPTGQAESHMLALSHDGRFGYTANVGPGTVSVLDLATQKLVGVLPIANDIQRISISNDDRLVFTADQTQPRLAVIDTAARRVRQWIALPSIGYGTAPTPDGRFLLVAMRLAGAVAVVDLRTLAVTKTIPTGGIPTEILVRPDGQTAYVSCGGNVGAIDLRRLETAGTIEVGRMADGMAWAQPSITQGKEHSR